MLTPEYLKEITEGCEELASRLHSYIIRRIVQAIFARLDREDDYILTARDKWQIETLQESGIMLEDIVAEIHKYTQLEFSEIWAALYDAGVRTIAYDNAVYEAAGITPNSTIMSPHIVRVMQRHYEAIKAGWRSITKSTADAAQKLFLSECDNALMKVTTGATTTTQAVREALEKIVKEGVKVTYTKTHEDGTQTVHTDTIETATTRAVRTGVGQTSAEISTTRMDEMDWDIVLVSAHLGARYGNGKENPSNHAWWQGKYYSRNGKTAGLPNFVECTGYGTGEGLCGWNCRHSFGTGDGDPAHNPWSPIDTKENKRIYDLTQKQRAIERAIRKLKRELYVLEGAIEAANDKTLKADLQADYDKRAYSLSQMNAKYKEFCAKNDLRPLNDRLQIAEWNRNSAAKASAAARRVQRGKTS